MKTVETSNAFTTLSEFNKEYKAIRLSIMARHGYKPGSKVKLVNAVMLWINFGNGFIKYTSNLTDMKDRIKMYENSSSNATFQLTAMV